MEIRILRSRRRSYSLEVKDEGILVRVPYFATKSSIDRFIKAHETWIKKNLTRLRSQRMQAEEAGILSEEEIIALKEAAKNQIQERVRHFATILQVDYGRISIRTQRSRWGSCSQKGNLSFNCLLMLAPPQVLDSVVAHELCHRKEMNHSPRFYALLASLCPDYKEGDRWLKEQGRTLLLRLSPKGSF